MGILQVFRGEKSGAQLNGLAFQSVLRLARLGKEHAHDGFVLDRNNNLTRLRRGKMNNLAIVHAHQKLLAFRVDLRFCLGERPTYQTVENR